MKKARSRRLRRAECRGLGGHGTFITNRFRNSFSELRLRVRRPAIPVPHLSVSSVCSCIRSVAKVPTRRLAPLCWASAVEMRANVAGLGAALHLQLQHIALALTQFDAFWSLVLFYDLTDRCNSQDLTQGVHGLCLHSGQHAFEAPRDNGNCEVREMQTETMADSSPGTSACEHTKMA